VRGDIVEIKLRIVVLIVASLALGEALGRDVPAVFAADFEGVRALGPSQIVRDLIEILNCELGGIRVRPNLKSAEIEKLQVGEVIQPREAVVSRRYVIRIPIKTKPKFIQQRGRECVVLTQGKHVETVGFSEIKRRQIRVRVN